MTIEQLDQIIALASEIVNHIGVWLVGGRCKGCGIDCRMSAGAKVWSIEHPASCPTQIAAQTQSWAKQQKSLLLANQ